MPIMALTATAIPAVQRAIKNALNLSPDCIISRQSLYRQNIQIHAVNKPFGNIEVGMAFYLKLLCEDTEINSGKVPTSLVFVTTVNDAEEVAAAINRSYPTAGAIAYHAQLSPHRRQQIEYKFMNGSIPTVVATVALSMGVDHPNGVVPP